MSGSHGEPRQLGVTQAADHGIASLASRLRQLSSLWLPHVGNDSSLGNILLKGTGGWSDAESDGSTRPHGPILYPLVYVSTPSISVRQFCEITDAAYEAKRAGTVLNVVGIQLGRKPRHTGDSALLNTILSAWQGVGLPLKRVTDLPDLPDLGGTLFNRTRTGGFSRRTLDLPDILVATAADTIHAGAVYLGEGVVPRRNLSAFTCIPALCSLYGRQPFEDPPPQGKLRPAGSDALWFLAFTAGFVDGPLIGDRRDRIRRITQDGIAYAWNHLRRSNAVHSGVLPPATEPLQVRLTALRGEPASRTRVVLPLFGSPLIAETTWKLVATVASTLGAGRLRLMVDDLSPRYLYNGYEPRAARERWEGLARGNGCSVRFLTDSGAAALGSTLMTWLHTLSGAHLLASAPVGLWNRWRGRYTGYDAIHLATMASACTADEDYVLALRGANLPAGEMLSQFLPVKSIAVVTGLNNSNARPQDARIVLEPDGVGSQPKARRLQTIDPELTGRLC